MPELVVKSPDFQHMGRIPKKFTGYGEDISPALEWENVPEDAKSLALIMDDPDAPDPKHPRPNPFIHWVVYNIPPDTKGFKQGASSPHSDLPPSTEQGINDFKIDHYKGPKPPIGDHRYRFKLYALDTPRLKFAEKPTAQKLEEAMKGHVLAQGELVGMFSKDDA
eukprot:jgi/Chlat1/3253/Chrsp22S03515